MRKMLSILALVVVGSGHPLPLAIRVPFGLAAHEDCLPYDPASLRVEAEKAGTWLLTDGRSRMAVFETEFDATNALAVARQHTAHCFIGRRPDRLPGVEVIEYWKGMSAVMPPIAQEGCISYTPSSLAAVDAGAKGWAVTDGAAFTLRVTDAADAAVLLSVAQRYSAYCAIGYARYRPAPYNMRPLHHWR